MQKNYLKKLSKLYTNINIGPCIHLLSKSRKIPSGAVLLCSLLYFHFDPRACPYFNSPLSICRLSTAFLYTNPCSSHLPYYSIYFFCIFSNHSVLSRMLLTLPFLDGSHIDATTILFRLIILEEETYFANNTKLLLNILTINSLFRVKN